MSTIDQRRLTAARDIVRQLAEVLELDGEVQLWDGKRYPLGPASTENGFVLKISGPGVVGALLRRPGLDSLIQQYISEDIDFEGGTLVEIGRLFNEKHTRSRLKKLKKGKLVKSLLPMLFATDKSTHSAVGFAGDETGRIPRRDNKEFIQFHYDLSNEFYKLFLDPEMQYSCAYFTDWSNSLEQAQKDKLEMICRKLRLKPGDRLLDIGSGWGGLICHAASNYDISAHGVTLSQEQYDYALNKITSMGLQDRVTVELKDYSELTGRFDKIASIGMYEHIGLANIPVYMQTVQRLLADNGLFLNHAIARRAKSSKKAWKRVRPEKKALAKYIFPGGELDNIGHSLQAMEKAGFEVQDVEAWREHYALTTEYWCNRLTANKDKATELVGVAKYRIWVAYLAGVSLAFSRGSALIFQTLVSKTPKGKSPLPPSRADLYK